MARHWENIWRFDTENYRVDVDISDCEDDPSMMFEYQEDIDAIADGSVDYFDVRCIVYKYDGHDAIEVGSDYLSGCCYKNYIDFIKEHRDTDPMNRNCSIMRAKRGDNVVICSYFPSMVRSAIEESRSR